MFLVGTHLKKKKTTLLPSFFSRFLLLLFWFCFWFGLVSYYNIDDLTAVLTALVDYVTKTQQYSSPVVSSDAI